MDRAAPCRSLLGVSPRLAESAAHAAYCCAADLAGMSHLLCRLWSAAPAHRAEDLAGGVAQHRIGQRHIERAQLGRLAGHLTPGATWPWGTFAANLIGGFAMGLLAGWLAREGGAAARIGGESLRLLLGVGLLGGFTTFSAFSLETMLMIDRGHAMTALGYALASVAGAIGALGLGLTLMRNVAA